MNRVLILGAAGGFGRLLAPLLAAEEYLVAGSDREEPADAPPGGFVSADVSAPNDALRERAREADWVLACLPAEAAIAAFRALSPEMRPGTLFLDILSVKVPICTALEAGRRDVESLSIHPMFAPSLGFRGHNVAVVPVRPGPHGHTVERLLNRWGARLHHLTAEQHDRATAAIQAATHAAVISFGLALREMGYRVDEALPISTPPHRALLALLARLAGANPSIYWQIQSENPLAEHARMQIAAGADHLQRLVAVHDEQSFTQMLGELAAMLGDAAPDLQDLAGRMFAPSASLSAG